jgi:hypothetical protein
VYCRGAEFIYTLPWNNKQAQEKFTFIFFTINQELLEIIPYLPKEKADTLVFQREPK